MFVRGEVTDNADPFQRGRCRVYVWGVHKEKHAFLPWAEVIGDVSFGSGASTVIPVGTPVWVTFEQDDYQCPIIVGIFHGHDGETMADISKETSDFNSNAKDEGYGKTWILETPGGNTISMSDKDETLKLSTPCGAELIMDCQSGKVTLTNGQASIILDGSNIILNGNVKQGNAEDKPYSERQQETEDACNPMQTEGRNSCANNFPANKSISDLEVDLQTLTVKAKELYYQNTKKELPIAETKMSTKRYVCLKRAGGSPLLEQVYGYAVDLNPNPMEGLSYDESERLSGCYSDKGDRVKAYSANKDQLCYASDNPEVRALTRILSSEVGGDHWGENPARNVASGVFNRIKSYRDYGSTTPTIVGIESAEKQFDHTWHTRLVRKNGNRNWESAKYLAQKYYDIWKSGQWEDSTGGCTSWLNYVPKDSWWINRMQYMFTDESGHRFYRERPGYSPTKKSTSTKAKKKKR